MRYLLVTHIPFSREPGGSILLDRLWAEDLRGLTGSIGPITVAAPENLDSTALQAWGAGMTTVGARDRITFISLPLRHSRLEMTRGLKLRSILRKAVRAADLIHTSNLFDPDTALYFAHDYAVRHGKKTLFVVAEDFPDMLQWEWVRAAGSSLQRNRRERTLARLDQHVRARVATASLTFLHTPAAVARYRPFARNAVAIRQPVHEREDVIASTRLQIRLVRSAAGAPLRLTMASRMQPLKGVDHLVRAIGILASRGVAVQARLFGDGPELPALNSLAERLGLGETIHFPGARSSASVLREALAEGDVFLMPHLTSDFGRAFFDAMAAGCPVVAFRSVASQDTVRDGIDGLLAPNADPEGLAACIARFHADRSLLASCARAARERALENTKSFWNNYRAGLIRELFPRPPVSPATAADPAAKP